MAIADDVSVATNGNVRYVGDAHGGASPGYYSVLELHRFLQDLADNQSESGDDLLSIIRSNPSERSTDNIITLLNSYNIDDTLAEHLYDGSITQDDGDTIYAGLELVGAVESGTNPQIVQNNALLTNYWGTGLNADSANNIIMRLCIKVRSGGSDIDGKRLRVQARELGDKYAEFSLTMGLGNSTAALFTSADLNNTTAAGIISGWSDISNTEGYQTIDIDNDGTPEPYYSQWDKGSRAINQLYERTKWIQRRGTSETIHGINGELFRGITHQFAYDNEASGPFTEDEIISWGTGATAGTGLLLALDDDGATGTIWMQLLTGVAPTDGLTITGGTSSATCDVNGTVTARSVSPEFFGVSTGSAIIGAFGIGVEAADLTDSDQLFDLTNTQQQPPNQQSFTVAGLVASEDYLLVGPNDGSDEIDYDQLSVSGAHSSGAGTLTVTTTIPSDTPASGVVRVFNGDSYDHVPYSSYSGAVFTLTGTLPNNVADSANAFVAYIDKLATTTSESFTAIHSSDRSLVVVVRDGGASPIKAFKTSATFTSTGGSVTAIRTSDL
jgi:hypothetical protein